MGQAVFAREGIKGSLTRGLGYSASIAVADFSIAPDHSGTLADAMDSRYTRFLETEDAVEFAQSDTGFLSKTDELRRLKNKAKIAAEGGMLGLAFDLALTGGRVVAPHIAPYARLAKEASGQGIRLADKATFQVVSKGFGSLMSSASRIPLGPKGTLGSFAKRKFTTTQGLDRRIFEEIGEVESLTKDALDDFAKNFELYDVATRQTAGLFAPLGSGKAVNQRAYMDLEDYMLGNLSKEDMLTRGYSETAMKAADRMFRARNKLSGDLERLVLRQQALPDSDPSRLSDLEAASILKAFEEMNGKYLRTIYTGGIDPQNLKGQFQSTEEFVNADGTPGRLVLEVMEAMTKSDPIFSTFGPAELRREAEEFIIRRISMERFENPTAAAMNVGKLQQAKADNIARGFGPDAVQTSNAVIDNRVPLYTISEGMFEARNKILDRSPFLRQLMGEVTTKAYAKPRSQQAVSPKLKGMLVRPEMTAKEAAGLRMMDTIADMASNAVTLKYFRDLVDSPEVTRNFSELVEGEMPLIIRADPSDFNAEKLLLNSGYIKIPEQSKTIFGGRYGALAGNYIKPEFFMAITQPVKNLNLTNQILDTLSQLKGISQASKTVFSLATQARNFNSIPMFLFSNGNIPRGGDVMDAMDIALGDLLRYSDDEMRALSRLMVRSGLMDQGAVLQETMAMLGSVRKEIQAPEARVGGIRSVADFTAEKLARLPGPVQTAVKLAKTPLDKTVGAATAAYRFSDNLARVASLILERKKYAAALRNPLFNRAGYSYLEDVDYDLLMPHFVSQGVAKRQTSRVLGRETDETVPLDQIDDLGAFGSSLDLMVADIAKDTVPNYGRTFEAGKQLAKFPFFGNFVAFATELMRNSANIVNQGIKELGFKATPELIDSMSTVVARKMGQNEGMTGKVLDAYVERTRGVLLGNGSAEAAAKEFAAEINAIGLRRLGGYVTAATIASPSIARGISVASGQDAERQEAMREVVADYFKDANIAMLSSDGRRVEYTNLSTNFPYDGFIGPAWGALFEYSRNRELGETAGVSARRATIDFVFRQLAPFSEEALLQQRLFDIMLRDGRTPQGIKIYDPEDSFSVKSEKSLAHLAGALTPTIVEEFYRLHSRGLEKGRVGAALSGEALASGYEPEMAKEVIRLTLGFTPLEINLPQTAYYAAAKYARADRSARSSMYDALKRSNTDLSDFRNDIISNQEDLFREQQNLYRKLRALGILGMDRDDALETMRLRGLSTVTEDMYDSISEGRFSPAKLNPNRAGRVEEEVELGIQLRAFDTDELEDSIDAANDFIEDNLLDLPLTEPFPYRGQSGEEVLNPAVEPQASVAPTQINTAPQLSSAPIPSTVTPVAAAQQPVDPSLLGDNPIEQARNLELANRLRGRS